MGELAALVAAFLWSATSTLLAGLVVRVPAPPAGQAPAAPGGKEVVAELAPRGERVALASGLIRPNIAFDLAKGTLQLPTQGSRTISFGQKKDRGLIASASLGSLSYPVGAS